MGFPHMAALLLIDLAIIAGIAAFFIVSSSLSPSGLKKLCMPIKLITPDFKGFEQNVKIRCNLFNWSHVKESRITIRLFDSDGKALIKQNRLLRVIPHEEGRN
jgi:hypothetical protein